MPVGSVKCGPPSWKMLQFAAASFGPATICGEPEDAATTAAIASSSYCGIAVPTALDESQAVLFGARIIVQRSMRFTVGYFAFSVVITLLRPATQVSLSTSFVPVVSEPSGNMLKR